ncbi:hypothetical protein HNR62_000404 [Oceanisphaera litoralis]|uniref:hypothetical protein n=1 Tax=Oceanisphaera litoralis TaxID=225144 RepID=UPI001959D3A7|nr:hypothetical protein [Oceanisphaera litoralis]MBM7454575.1 hypothetical protein [Oceanisphaera litoralis]
MQLYYQTTTVKPIQNTIEPLYKALRQLCNVAKPHLNTNILYIAVLPDPVHQIRRCLI